MNQTMLAASTVPSTNDNAVSKSTTSRKIGKITYLIESSSSETATETLNCKIEQMILRECSRTLK